MERIPAVSVIMSTYGWQNVEYFNRAIQSVLGQTFTDFELILCNDGSVREQSDYLHKLADTDKRIKVIDNPENRGLAYSLNLCIDAARGKYLARMDDDDICDPERLRIQLDYLERHPEVDFVGCNAKLIHREGVWGHRKMPERPEKKDFLKFSPYIHPSVVFRRKVFEGQEAYRTDTRRGEDYDLFMRLTAAGYRGYNIQEELFSYREDSESYKRRELGSRLDEVKIRCHGFSSLGLMVPWGWIYALRPLAAGCVPSSLVYKVKRMYHLRAVNRSKEDGRKASGVPQGTFDRSDTVLSVRKVI